jgi:hypothetical protein
MNMHPCTTSPNTTTQGTDSIDSRHKTKINPGICHCAAGGTHHGVAPFLDGERVLFSQITVFSALLLCWLYHVALHRSMGPAHCG